MRVLLRDIASGEYFVQPGMWDREVNHALDCHTTREATARAREAGLGALEIVVMFEQMASNFVVPVGKATDPMGWRTEPHHE